ncbi:hypothetical protein OAQ45_02375 [Candidatus Marinimicrobia bacterium]|nr:hypothetical protein [Candidatus Neomarinimicrobiota bacterium]
MTDRTVIGADAAVANPDLGTQTFMGATVVDFSCNSTWDNQGATCTVNLIEDSGQRVDTTSVVGQPQYFEIVNTAGSLVFCFYGILKDIGRTVSSNGERKYSTTLQSPTVLLQASSIITEMYAGAGDAAEAVAPNQIPADTVLGTAGLEFGHANSQVNFANVYNLLNPFGAFENDDFGISTPLGFGASQINSEGMRVESFVAAIDALINGSNQANPTLGRPIIYGADSWGDNPSPYYYTFDIYRFVNSISSFIPFDYRVQSTTLMGFVDELCKEINHVYMVDLRKPAGLGTAGITGPFGVATDNASEGFGTFGGEIHIITQNRNVYGATKFPLSYQLVRREVSDRGSAGPLTAFSNGLNDGFGDNDLPLDFAWGGYDIHPGGPPNASSPFGGSAPFEDITQDSIERYTQTNLQVSLNEDAVGGKVVVGGFQSRIGFVPNDPGNVYQYWGNIARLDNFGSNASASDTAQRGFPVVTKNLHVWDLRDIILIDIQHLLGNTSITDVVFSGVYACSMQEMMAAMTGYDRWNLFMNASKPRKLDALNSYFTAKLYAIKKRMYLPNGKLSYAGKGYLNSALSSIASYNTSSENSDRGNLDSFDPIFAAVGMSYESFLQQLQMAIKNIGDLHYGKSWLVQAPAFTTKLDENEESVIADYARSWEISDDAYLEPSNFAASEAPQSPFFINKGRLKSYVNYDANFTTLPYPYQNVSLQGTTVNYDFSEYGNQQVAQTSLVANGNSIFGFPVDVEKEYYFLPITYFSQYEEGNFTSFQNTKYEVYNNDTMRANSSTVETAELTAVVSYIFSDAAKIADGGIGMLPYYLCKTNKVNFPMSTDAQSSLLGRTTQASERARQNLNDEADAPANAEPIASETKNIDGKNQQNAPKADIRAAVAPRSFGIAQQSNRFVYGPWVTNNISLSPATKVEYDQDPNLVPENYIIPSVVTFGGVQYTLTSGLAGLNTVGQIKANTIENFNYLFTEQGSVTHAGLPEVTNLAVSLVSNGPLVSDISVNISAAEITTNYSMKTFAPKFGRTNKRILDRLGNLGKKMQSLLSLVK